MSLSPSSSAGGHPSTTAPSAGPWLSPQVVKRKTRPKVFTLMGRRHWPNSRAMSTIRRCCEREPNGAAALQFEAQRIFFRRRRRIDDRLFAEVSRDDSSSPVEGLLAPVDLVAVVVRDIKSAVMH